MLTKSHCTFCTVNEKRHIFERARERKRQSENNVSPKVFIQLIACWFLVKSCSAFNHLFIREHFRAIINMNEVHQALKSKKQKRKQPLTAHVHNWIFIEQLSHHCKIINWFLVYVLYDKWTRYIAQKVLRYIPPTDPFLSARNNSKTVRKVYMRTGQRN